MPRKNPLRNVEYNHILYWIIEAEKRNKPLSMKELTKRLNKFRRKNKGDFVKVSSANIYKKIEMLERIGFVVKEDAVNSHGRKKYLKVNRLREKYLFSLTREEILGNDLGIIRDSKSIVASIMPEKFFPKNSKDDWGIKALKLTERTLLPSGRISRINSRLVEKALKVIEKHGPLN